MLMFSSVTYYTSTLLAACYRSGDTVHGKRNYTYMDSVISNLGGFKVKICGLVQYLNLFGVAIGYTITASISMIFPTLINCGGFPLLLLSCLSLTRQLDLALSSLK
ncbi:hypothetical protein V6N11_079737 [Hibiscus sabdariffa]|uniref:Amino acid transporter transmembrane domain-containing protein n=1 Tax=Hibiscus sabdariffa TaxID=183260 RepID=A0ABR2RWM1_9ROSI